MQVLAQGELREQEKGFLYRNEKSVSVFIKNNGYGIDYRNATHINAFRKNLWEVSFNTIKSPREYKIYNPWYGSFEKYVYGKENFCFDLRFSVGHQRQLYEKFDYGGIEVRYFYLVGGALGFMKPIYYEIYTPLGEYFEEKFDLNKHRSGDIIGKASFLKGIDETSVNPGAYIRTGVNFEYSKNERKLKAFEVGAEIYAYMRNMKIMATDNNSRFFFSLFLAYRIGFVYQFREEIDVGNIIQSFD